MYFEIVINKYLRSYSMTLLAASTFSGVYFFLRGSTYDKLSPRARVWQATLGLRPEISSPCKQITIILYKVFQFFLYILGKPNPNLLTFEGSSLIEIVTKFQSASSISFLFLQVWLHILPWFHRGGAIQSRCLNSIIPQDYVLEKTSHMRNVV